jgi:hypothetical protein
MDLANEFLSLTRGKEINKQSIIMLHSLSHIARAGTEGYAEDLLLVTFKIKAVMGQAIQVIPLPHLFLAGCTCPMTIRTAAEIAAWSAKVYGQDGRYLTASFQTANYLLSPMMGDNSQMDYERLCRLPSNTNWPAAKETWLMNGLDLPLQIQPTLAITESEILCTLISELRTGVALDLYQDPVFDRKIPIKDGSQLEGQSAQKTEYLILGRTGPAAMMAEALERAGKKNRNSQP